MLIGVAERRRVIARRSGRRPVGGVALRTTLGARLLRAVLGRRLALMLLHGDSLPAQGGG